MMTQNLDGLKRHTSTFFKRHWGKHLNEAEPTWSGPYIWQGALPKGNKQGVYAFFTKGELVYVGKATAKGGGIYEGHGLGARLISYLKWDRDQPSTSTEDRHFRMRAGRFEDVDEIHTCAIPKEYVYMAYALEQFLIKELQPPLNIQGK